MSYTSIVTADRMTYLKIVAVSLICATVVAGIGIAARVTNGTTAGSQTEANMIRAGAPVIATTNGVTIRPPLLVSSPETLPCEQAIA